MKLENPVMCLIAFLSIAFDPKIASEVAKKVLGFLLFYCRGICRIKKQRNHRKIAEEYIFFGS